MTETNTQAKVSDSVWKSAMEIISDGRVVFAKQTAETIWGKVISSDKETVYLPNVGLDGTWSCGCYAAVTYKVCSHIVAVLATMGLRPMIAFLLQREQRGANEMAETKVS